MDTHEKNRIIFNEAKKYLEQNANSLKYQQYFIMPKIDTLEEAFEVAVSSVRDITVISGVIHYNENYSIIKECLFDFDYKKVLNQYGSGKDERYQKLYRLFRDKIISDGEDTPNNSWCKFARNICGVADYLSNFNSIEELLCYLNQPNNTDERIQLAKEIVSRNIFLWKFKMVCNWLKDIGANGFAKPDNVLTYILTGLKLADDNDESVFKAVNLMAEDTNTSVFIIDRVLWLIGTSDASVIKEIERKRGSNKEDFVKIVLSKINDN